MTIEGVTRFAGGWAALVAWSIFTFTLFERVRPRHRNRPGARQIASAATLLAVDAALAVALVRAAHVDGRRLVLGWFAAECAHYGIHRAMHAVPFLWRFHRLHHEGPALAWTSTWRVHPVDAALTASTGLVAAALVGGRAPVAAWFVVGRRVWAIVLHANVAWPATRLDRWIATPAFHARHHRENLAPAHFAATLPVLDWLFGTADHDHSWRSDARAAGELAEATAAGARTRTGSLTPRTRAAPRRGAPARDARASVGGVSCRHLAAIDAGLGTTNPGALETGFTIDASRITFGPGVLAEVGPRARALGMRRAALVTDVRLRELSWFAEVMASLRGAGVEPIVYDAVAIEPTEASWDDAIQFARDAKPDGFISLGGGSVIDTAKVANLYTAHPAPFAAYINAPLGDGRPVPGPLAPHLACPTTAGTGSEVTGIAIFDWHAHRAKTGISSPRLRPTEAVVDPRVTHTLPAAVVAAAGMDVLCHALESYTARAFTSRAAPATPLARPASQGRNPWSDLGCREALRLCGAHLVDAFAGDRAAREQMMWAATLAGIAFGNAGVHVPHAMAYAVAGQVKAFCAPGYPELPLVPHGMAVAVNAPAVFRLTAATSPARHFEAAQLLGADTLDAADPTAASCSRRASSS